MEVELERGGRGGRGDSEVWNRRSAQSPDSAGFFFALRQEDESSGLSEKGET